MIDWDAAVLAPLTDVFGETVTYDPVEGDRSTVTGIFDEAYHELDLAGGSAVTTETPVLGVRLSQFALEPRQDDTLTIVRTGEVYVVREVRKDGHGHAKLMLNFIGEG